MSFDQLFKLILRFAFILYMALALGLVAYWLLQGRHQGQLGHLYLLGAVFCAYLGIFTRRAATPAKRELSFRQRMERRQANRAKRQPPAGPNPYEMKE